MIYNYLQLYMHIIIVCKLYTILFYCAFSWLLVYINWLLNYFKAKTPEQPTESRHITTCHNLLTTQHSEFSPASVHSLTCLQRRIRSFLLRRSPYMGYSDAELTTGACVGNLLWFLPTLIKTTGAASVTSLDPLRRSLHKPSDVGSKSKQFMLCHIIPSDEFHISTLA